MLYVKKLSKQRIKEFGYIFKTNYVPVLSEEPELAILEGKKGKHKIFKIDLPILTIQQREYCFQYVSKLIKANKKEVEECFENYKFIPVQAGWFEGY